jgi:hypothetical protein
VCGQLLPHPQVSAWLTARYVFDEMPVRLTARYLLICSIILVFVFDAKSLFSLFSQVWLLYGGAMCANLYPYYGL